MRGRCHAVLDAAWGLGIRYFDAARSYGRAEEFLAKWLKKREVAPEQVTIGSKWGYTYTADWKVEAKHHEIKNHSLPLLQKQCVESTRILGKHLDLYQIHSATLESGVLADQAVMEELAWLRDQGMVIGLSLSGPQQTETLQVAMEIKIGGKRVFDCVQATWNVLEKSAGPTLQAAHQQGMGVIVKEALANGRLTSRNLDPEFTRQREVLEAEAKRLETTVDAICPGSSAFATLGRRGLERGRDDRSIEIECGSIQREMGSASGNPPLQSSQKPAKCTGRHAPNSPGIRREFRRAGSVSSLS